MKPTANHVIFYSDTELETVRKGKGYEGTDLVIPVEKWMDHTRCYGEVIALPDRLQGQVIVAHDHPGFPVGQGYYDGGLHACNKYIDNIHDDVRVGDRIYFDFDVLGDKQYANGERLGDGYFALRYDQIICAIRDGEIIMIGGWVLIEPKVIKNLRAVRDMAGNLLEEKFWIQTSTQRETKVALRGRLCHIGKPLKCDEPLDVAPGDNIIFSEYSEYEMEIEGQKYFCMKQRDIMAVYKPEYYEL